MEFFNVEAEANTLEVIRKNDDESRDISNEFINISNPRVCKICHGVDVDTILHSRYNQTCYSCTDKIIVLQGDFTLKVDKSLLICMLMSDVLHLVLIGRKRIIRAGNLSSNSLKSV